MANSTPELVSHHAQEFRLGDVFGRSFELLSRRFVPFLALTVIAYLPVFLAAFVLSGSGTSIRASDAGAAAGMTGILSLLCASLASAATTYGVVQELRGRPFAVSESLAIALRRILPLLGVALCTGVLVGLGFLALVVPGLIVLCVTYVAAPACIVERTGVFASLSRSAALTKGHRWQIFGIVLVLFIVSAVVMVVLETAVGGYGANATMLVNGAWQALAGTFGAVLVGVLYFRLRGVKDGVDVDQIASVFA